MRINALVISEDSGEFNGKKGTVKYQQIAMLDQDPNPAARMVNTFDYRLSEAEKGLYGGKLLGKSIVLDVKDIAIFNSRIQVKAGMIASVPALETKK